MLTVVQIGIYLKVFIGSLYKEKVKIFIMDINEIVGMTFHVFKK